MFGTNSISTLSFCNSPTIHARGLFFVPGVYIFVYVILKFVYVTLNFDYVTLKLLSLSPSNFCLCHFEILFKLL